MTCDDYYTKTAVSNIVRQDFRICRAFMFISFMKQVWSSNDASALKTEPVTGGKMSHHQTSLIFRIQAKWKLGKELFVTCNANAWRFILSTIHFLSKGVRLHLSSTRNPASLSPLSFSKNYIISDIVNISFVPFSVSEKLFASYTELCICHDCIMKYCVRWIFWITTSTTAFYAWQKPNMNGLLRALKL
jgi:hypothetical protein